MKLWKKDEIIARVNEILPEGKVVPRHSEKGHFYEVRRFVEDDLGTASLPGPIYPSVTGKIQVLKDEGLINYKMNRAIEHFRNFIFSLTAIPTMEQIDIEVAKASRISQDILEDAGDVGTRIHNLREVIFRQWIDTGIRPADFPSFIPKEEEDTRVISAIRALQKFCEEKDYIPVACELLVFNHDLEVAGTLDDLGLMKYYKRPRDPNCKCATDKISEDIPSHFNDCIDGWHRCLECNAEWRYEFVLMDLKTSNQFKDHYFFQVALYWWMLWKLLGKEWKPERCFILKVSKEDGSYKIEDLKQPSKLSAYCRAMIKTNEGIDFIKSLRKDNQKVVAPLMKL